VKILLDTNVILDFLLEREVEIKSADEIFKLTFKDKIKACATANSITDIYYIAVKKLGDIKTREALRELFNLLEIISVDGSDCIIAVNLPISDFEDGIIVVCADKADIDYIITNDKDFLSIKSQSSILTPAEFLKLLDLQK
jgi:predicted nucleic acid-binding protein